MEVLGSDTNILFLQQRITEFKSVSFEQVKTVGLFIKELMKIDEGNNILKKLCWADLMCYNNNNNLILQPAYFMFTCN